VCVNCVKRISMSLWDLEVNCLKLYLGYRLNRIYIISILACINGKEGVCKFVGDGSSVYLFQVFAIIVLKLLPVQ